LSRKAALPSDFTARERGDSQMIHGCESDHERATIERLKLLGYEYLPGPDIVRDEKEVVLRDVLRSSLRYRYPVLSEAELDLAVVCMTRANAVRVYDALKALPECPEVKIVMTGDISNDPKEWSEAGHITTKFQRDAVKGRMVDPDDPLKMVIVCDMWLTGTDIPCLHTLYVDKPMRGHSMIQAISRVNRVFQDKPHGLIVDYIGIGDQLREATSTYTQGGGRGDPAPEIGPQAFELFCTCLEEIRRTLPESTWFGDWRKMDPIAFEDMHRNIYDYLNESDDRIEQFLSAELRLSKAYLLVSHMDETHRSVDEVICYQRIRNQVRKLKPGENPDQAMEKAVRDLVDDHIESDGVVDIFKLSGIEAPDISILNDEFLQTFKNNVPQLFDFNAFCVLSDGNSALHGMWKAGMEWFAPWKSIDGVVSDLCVGVLHRGLFVIGILELKHYQGKPVDIDDNVRASSVFAHNRELVHHLESIGRGVCPIDGVNVQNLSLARRGKGLPSVASLAGLRG
jgi:hypothetical protein